MKLLYEIKMKNRWLLLFHIDYAKNRQWVSKSSYNLQNRNREDLTKSTSMVPAKCPPNVKLEIISNNSRVAELGKLRVF